MFRQLLLLISLIAAAKALQFNHTQGVRVDGDVFVVGGEGINISPYPQGSEFLSVTIQFVSGVNQNVTFGSYYTAQVLTNNIL